MSLMLCTSVPPSVPPVSPQCLLSSFSSLLVVHTVVPWLLSTFLFCPGSCLVWDSSLSVFLGGRIVAFAIIRTFCWLSRAALLLGPNYRHVRWQISHIKLNSRSLADFVFLWQNIIDIGHDVAVLQNSVFSDLKQLFNVSYSFVKFLIS